MIVSTHLGLSNRIFLHLQFHSGAHGGRYGTETLPKYT